MSDDPKTWEQELLDQGKEVQPGPRYRCPQCDQATQAFAIVLEDGEWSCGSCRNPMPGEGLPEGVHGGETEPTIEDVRGVRRSFLESTDWSQLPDVPADKREAWADLRQQARDVTTTHPDVGQALDFLYDLRAQGEAI